MYLKSDAIVIHRRPVMNTSYVLRCYTKRAGRITVLAKGAARRRRKDTPPSVPDLFQSGEVVLWFGARRDYAILSEWSLDEMRRGLRDDYDAFRAASACASLVNELSRHTDARAEYYELLESALRALNSGVPPRPVLWAFGLHAFKMAGFLAPLQSCAGCGRKATSGGQAALCPSEGGLICMRCASRVPEGEAPRLELSRQAVGTARFLSASPVGTSSNLKVSQRSSTMLDHAVRMLAEYHLEKPMPVLLPEKSA